MVEPDTFLINDQNFLAVLLILDDLVRRDAFVAETQVDCNEVLRGVEGEEIPFSVQAVGDLRNLAANLTCVFLLHLSVQSYDG